jgi:hypothetical protein
MKIQIFHPSKNIIFKKFLQDIITNLKFQQKPKYHISKILHIKINRPIIYYLGAYKNPLSYYTL